ncbi:hypothetical protein ACP8VM_22395, partial [Klebsiella pneumoniae]
LIRCVCGKKIGPDPRNFNQRVSLGRNDLLIRTFPKWFSPGGSSILAFTKDYSFNSIAGLNLSSIDKLNESYVKHYLRD